MTLSPDNCVRAIASQHNGLVTAPQALQCGLTRTDIATRIRRGEWRAIARGVYLVDADMYVDGIPVTTLWRAALLAHGSDYCLVGLTGAEAIGLVGLPPRDRDIEVARVGGGSRHVRPTAGPARLVGANVGIVVRQLAVNAHEIVMVNGFPVRDAFHTVVDAALLVDRATTLALLDSALHLKLLTRTELFASVDGSQHRRGIVAVRQLAVLADGRAASQVESRVRLACIDGDVPPDELQYTVSDINDNVVGIGDLAWLANRRRPLLGEADGESVHSLPKPVYRDRLRGNALVGEACDTIRFVYSDTFRRGYIAWAVRAALQAA